ncbi:flagellin [Shimia sp. MMG029]|uniref:flagellin n=1 Tax=Shimia sp. MMG029 TaxID=3021978 RepID=UPI0022FDC321|nr:flagellin [Shimia sp. MMG029]MDA5557424.1 flagellin [Shimia sp. MMG029]
MTSLLTNNGAMVALQTLKSVNASLSETQGQISTGKKVDNAKQNAAVWAISKTMESDVNGFKAVQESLSLGESTVAVARQASETVTDLLGEIKTRIASATGENVDRTKLTNEINSLKEQIGSVVGAAQFNGLNLVNGGGGTSVLSSLDRAGSGVSAETIAVAAQDLSQADYAAKNTFSTTVAVGGASVSTAADAFSLTVDAGSNASIGLNGTDTLVEGDSVSITIGDRTASYTVTASDVTGSSDVAEIAAQGLKAAVDNLGITGLTVEYAASGTPASDQLTFNVAGGGQDLTISGQFKNAGSGGLAALETLSIGTPADARTALGTIETLINTTINAGAAFGTVENRISIQKDFVSGLSDSVKSGIGALVDADMEETSARLQALQVQQQLATQSLSIANQGPQQLLSLFR